MEKNEHTHKVTPEPLTHHKSSGRVSKLFKGVNMNTLAVPVSIIIAGLLIASSIVLTNNGGIKVTKKVAASGAVAGDVAVDEDLKIKDDDHIMGNKDADVVLIEWSDPECPFCKRHHDTMNSLLKKYDGKIAWVYRHFTLDFHEYAKKEAESIECAAKVGGDEGFTKYLDNLFSTTEGNNSLKRADLTKIATMSGLDTGKFDACVDSGEMAGKVQSDMDAGLRVGVQGTPYTIAVNVKTGKQRVINGAQPLEMITATLSQMIAE